MIASIKKPFALASALLLVILTVAPAAAVIEAEEAFYNTWARTDLPVADGLVDRTWMWGPQPNTEVISEPYADHPAGERPVQYYDKARMEVNNPNAEYDGLWYVTNGLLVVELMTGMMQVGHFEFEDREPANVNIAGDPGYAETPTYATYSTLMDTPPFAEGATITATVDAQGNVGSNDDLAEWDVTAGVLAPETGHRTASVFWEFMTSEGLIWDWETGDFMNGLLFENPYYATGLPITEAYWAFIYVDGTQQWVLTQAFERRVLTYTPLSDPGWQVEAGNVGLHYHEWRYEMAPPPPVSADFYVEFGELNDSGVSGYAALHLEGDQLTVMVEASGLEANETHAMHIHGFEDGQQATCPTPDMAGEDGLLEFAEGLPAYGPVVLGLEPFMTADDDGNISFSETYTFAATPEELPLLTMAIHGLTVGEGDAAAYDASIPVACGVITEGERPAPPPPEAQEFHFMLGALNDSGASGSGTLTLEDGMLTVMFEASGLEAGQEHAHHIHGFADFQQSLCPTPDMDEDESGLIEFAEGQPAYGDVVLNLAPASAVDDDGTATYNETFDLDDLGLDFNAETLVAHTIVVHGMTVGDEYVGDLPVACGAIIPEEGFVSILSGEAELPTPVESDGTGFATFHVPADDSALAFTLVVNGLEDVTAVHIHLKDEGEETGDPVLFLFATDDGPVASNGVLNSEVVGDLDLVGPLEGEPMSALIDAILAGETYVNVHTTAYPAGEIRGEMVLASDHFDVGNGE